MEPVTGADDTPGGDLEAPAAAPGVELEAPADLELLERVETEMDEVERSLAALAAEDGTGADPSEIVAWLPDGEALGAHGGNDPAS